MLFKIIVILELCRHFTEGIYHPDGPTDPPKWKERIDLKPIDLLTSPRPPVKVFSGKDQHGISLDYGIGRSRSWEQDGDHEGRSGQWDSYEGRRGGGGGRERAGERRGRWQGGEIERRGRKGGGVYSSRKSRPWKPYNSFIGGYSRQTYNHTFSSYNKNPYYNPASYGYSNNAYQGNINNIESPVNRPIQHSQSFAPIPARHEDRLTTSHSIGGDTGDTLVCPSPHGLFPYIKDCSKFINCHDSRAFLQSCALGTLFNQVIKQCDWPSNVKCPGTGIPQGGDPQHFQPVEQPTPVKEIDKPSQIGDSHNFPSIKLPSPVRRVDTHSLIPQQNRDFLHGTPQTPFPPPFGKLETASPSSTPIPQIIFKPVIPQQSSLGSIVGMVSGASSVVDSVVKLVSDKVDRFQGKMDWTYVRAKDKGKRLLRKLGVNTSKTLCLKPEGVFPYPKDCKRFVNCWRGKPSLQKCSPGTLFNAIKGFCDFPSRVVCPKTKTTSKGINETYLVAPPSGQNIRLRGGDVPWAGYVQIEVERSWRIITDLSSQWTRADADVVCRSLGFTRGAELSTQGRTFGIPPRLDAVYGAVECLGTEDDIRQCQIEYGTQEDVDATIVGVRCMKNWVSECGIGGVQWGSKCYYAHSASRLTHAQARRACSTNNARLLSIQSQSENDFISELLSSSGGDDEVGFHTGGVRTDIFGDTFWLWQNSTVSIPPSPVLPYANWWPGWNVSSSIGESRHQRIAIALDVDTEGDKDSTTKCIVLKDHFPISNTIATTAPAEYFFWKLTNCEEKLHYVCETDRKDVGCISGRGETYSGEATTTVEGQVCVFWSDSQVQEKVRHLITPQRPFVRNHCANPDGDDLPWCYTSKNTVDFCDIPRCEQEQQDKPILAPDLAGETSPCAADKFHCGNGICIHQEWHCDGQEDCDNGSDEEGCRNYSTQFSKLINKRLKGREVEKWLYTLKTTCAARCSQAKHFQCLSFNYESSSETCMLSDSNVARSGGLFAESGWEYYELESAAIDCSDMFRCTDGKCLNKTQECNGRRECSNGEDEDGCDGRVNFQVRLVNGTSEHEGRVEVKAFGRWASVCDDMWGLPEGDVVCQSLGFPLGAKEVFQQSHFGSGDNYYLMDDLNCDGNEDSLAYCDFAGWGEHDCQDSEAAGVSCFKLGDECGRDQWRCLNGRCVGLSYLCDRIDDCRDNSDEDRQMCQASLEVQLVDANSVEEKVSAGRVEVKRLGVWGTVCDDDFGIEEGHVLCRMMGWAGASAIDKNNTFGPGSGRIWLDDLRCLGYESSVADCQHLPWGQTNCDHTEDVGLHCSDTPFSGSDYEDLDDPSLLEATSDDLLTSLTSSCGQRSIEDNPNALTLEKPKIISGHMPPAGSHPWMVNINLLRMSGPTQWCGGAILTEDYILTAAHCLNNYPASTYVIRIGDFNTNKEESEEQEFRVASISIHPQFDKGPYLNNDIAILKIKRRRGQGIRFGQYVQPVCLVPRRWHYPAYLNCTVAGWGSLGATLGRSSILQSASLPILPEEICRADHIYGSSRLSDGMFCAGYLEGGIDTCQGDSGGPLVCTVDGRYTVVGITSWGHGCARANKPGVYTKVTHFLSWLYANLV